MASVNKVILVGNLGRDPEKVEFGSNGGVLCNLSLATSRRYNDRNGQQVEETEWHRVVLFGRTAEIAVQYLRKGSQAYIEGRIRTRKYTDKEGIERYSTEIVGETLQLLDRRGDDRQNIDDGFTSAPRTRPQPQRQAAPAPAQSAPDSIDTLEEDVPF